MDYAVEHGLVSERFCKTDTHPALNEDFKTLPYYLQSLPYGRVLNSRADTKMKRNGKQWAKDLKKTHEGCVERKHKKISVLLGDHSILEAHGMRQSTSGLARKPSVLSDPQRLRP